MKSTGIKVNPVTVEDMFNDEENAAYNPSIWKKSVERYAKMQNVQFYRADKDELYSYQRFFVSYELDGMSILKQWNAFSSTLTNNGFRTAFIIDGEIFTKAFGQNGELCIKNCPEGIKWLKENICKYGVLITNDI